MRKIRTENLVIGVPWLLFTVAMVISMLQAPTVWFGVTGGGFALMMLHLALMLGLAALGLFARRRREFVVAAIAMFLAGAWLTMMTVFTAGMASLTLGVPLIVLSLASWAASVVAMVVGLLKGGDRRTADQGGVPT
jgi:hypothetical protein